MTITIVGMGLIGGSLALDLRTNGFADWLIGVDANPLHTDQAMELGLVDEILPLESACMAADLVILAVPVSGIVSLFPRVLDLIPENGVVVDMGSTKGEIIRRIAGHPRRSRAVPAHPMAGTEFSGPAAAVNNLFHGKAAIICDRAQSDPQAVHVVERLFKSLFMRIIYMDAREHDIHTAYVSHISHITSFVLALTVLDKEKSEANIFNLASGGFSSTVRLAKSSPRMWRDVYEQNSENILDVLNNYIEKMGLFRDLIARGEYDETYSLMEAANGIGPILNGIK